MEEINRTNPAKAPRKAISTAPLRVKKETKRRILQELAKANKKEFGRRIRVDDLISLAISLVNSDHVLQMQEASLSNSDRLEKRFREHVRLHGPTTRDAFIGCLLDDPQSGTADPCEMGGSAVVKAL